MKPLTIGVPRQPRLIFFRVFVLLVMGAIGIACSGAQVSYVAAGNTGAPEIAAPKGNVPATKGSSALPLCPPGGVVPLQSSPDTGHHKVTLSWNASAISSSQRGDAVGYCLYRSKKPHAAKKNPTCTLCERINAVPVASLSCVDDLVEDSTTYYYVVTAINPASRISSSSNEIAAPVPSAHQADSEPAGSLAPPLCRVPPGSK